MKKDNIEELFSSLEGFEQTPPPEMWEAIENQLDEPKKKRRVFAWWWYGAAACFVLGLGWLINPFSVNSAVEAQSFVESPVKQSEKSSIQTKWIGRDKIESPIIGSDEDKTFSLTDVATIHIKSTHSIHRNDRGQRGAVTDAENIYVKHDKKFLTDANNKKGNQDDVNELELIINNPVKGVLLNDSIANIVWSELVELNDKIEGKEDVKDENSVDSKNNQRWSLQVYSSVLNSKQGETSNAATIDNSSQAYGLKTNYQINNKWKIRVGINVNDFGQQTQSENKAEKSKISTFPDAYANLDPDESEIDVIVPSESSSGSVVYYDQNGQPIYASEVMNDYVVVSNNAGVPDLVPSSFEKENKREELRYIELPLELSYDLFQKKKMSISLNSGGVLGRLISNKQFVNGVDVGGTDQAKEYIYGLILSTTLQYQIFKQAYLYAEPGMNYYVQPVESQNLKQANPTVQMGLTYKF